MIRRLFWAAVCVLVAGRAFAQQIEVDTAGGHTLFVKKGCNECHSIWGVGGRIGPDLGRSSASSDIFDLAGKFWNHSPQMMAKVERRGTTWPTFDSKEMARLLSYLYTLNLLEAPGDPDKGKRLLREKQCLSCHRLGGAGGTLATPLDAYASYTNVIPLTEGMWNAGELMRRLQAGKGVPIPQFEGRDMADIQAAIRRQGLIKGGIRYLPLPDIKRGMRLFSEKSCGVCHGANGGGGARGPSLLERERNRGLSQMTGALWNHSYAMGERMRAVGIRPPHFATGEMADILAYLYLEGFLGAQPGSAATGAILMSKRGCAACHTQSGSRSTIGPNLNSLAESDNPVPLITAMWNHAPDMRKWMASEAIPWPTFQKDDLKNIWAHLQQTATKKSK